MNNPNINHQIQQIVDFIKNKNCPLVEGIPEVSDFDYHFIDSDHDFLNCNFLQSFIIN